MKSLKKSCLALVVVLFVTTAHADIPKTFHLIKARIKTDTESFIRYAVIIGELPLDDYVPDSVFNFYKKNPKVFTEMVNSKMGLNNHDTISLYPQFFRVREYGLLLLPEDQETKIARNQIREIAPLEYIKWKEFNSLIFTEILSSDSSWVTWKPAEVGSFSGWKGGLPCGALVLYFNKPDDISKAVVEKVRAAFNMSGGRAPDPAEIVKLRKRLRKLRVIIYYGCNC